MNKTTESDIQETADMAALQKENCAVSISPDIIKLLSETKAGADEQLNEIGDYTEYVPDADHPFMKSLEEWKKFFIDSRISSEKLEGMKLIADDELELMDGTVVKIGYPDIPTDGTDSIQVKMRNGKMATLFKHGTGLYNYCEKMKKQGFRLAGSENDPEGEIFKEEINRIFDMFPGSGTKNDSMVIIDLLGRGLAGNVWNEEGDFQNDCNGLAEYFWGRSETSESDARYAILDRTHGNRMFDENSKKLYLGALFIRFPEENRLPKTSGSKGNYS